MATTPTPMSVLDIAGVPPSQLLADPPLLLSTVPSPVPSPTAAAARMSTPIDATPANLRTIGTQTDNDIVCAHCGGNPAFAKIDVSSSCEDPQASKRSKGRAGRAHRGRQWTREELLRLRDGAEKSAPASASAVLFQSIPIPVPQG